MIKLKFSDNNENNADNDEEDLPKIQPQKEEPPAESEV